MIRKLVPSIAAASLLLFGACSTSKLAQQDYNDDVYYSVAQAREAAAPVYEEEQKQAEKRSDDVVTDSELYGDEYSRYSFNYADRIHRFHRYSPWRGYYDWYYDPFYRYNNPYAYNPYPYYYSPGWSFSIHVGRPYWHDPFYYDRYYYGYGYGYGYFGYGHPYAYNRWGIYSYYNTYPGYGIGRSTYASPNYRPRPARGFENITNSGSRPSTGRGTVRTDNDGRIIDTRTRAERYGDGRDTGSPNSIGNTRTDVSSSARPVRTDVSRPTRSTGSTSSNRGNRSSSETSARPTRTERYTPPPAPSSSERSSSGSSSSGSGRSSSGSSSSGRPTRGN